MQSDTLPRTPVSEFGLATGFRTRQHQGRSHTLPTLSPFDTAPLASVYINALVLATLVGAASLGAPQDSGQLPKVDLGPLAPADTACHVMARPASSSGVTRVYSISPRGPLGRVLLVGVDSENQPRMFGAALMRKQGDTIFNDAVNVSYDLAGHMKMPLHTLSRHEYPSGAGDSKSTSLSTADTIRVRQLTAEIVRRCVQRP